MTTVINDGSRIKGSVTEKLTRTIRARARVGRDARFSGFDAELTVKAERYERGLQTVSTIVRKASASRSGAISLSPAHVKTTVKLAGAPRGVEGAIERAVSSDFKRSDPFEDAQSTFAERLRQHILEAEPKWYDVPNQCATLTLDPPAVQKLPEGSTMLVRGTVKSAQGTESGGDFATTAIARGQFNGQKPASEPGSPAVFEAKAAEPDASDVTVSADLLATSPAGRATASWSAISPPPAVDITYSGTMDYARNEGNASTDSQHLVKADYQWSVSWKDVDLDSGLAAMAASSSFDGDWSDTGRHGAAGPGNFLCGGPLVSLNPEFAMVTATATSASHYRLKAMPFLSVHPDYEDIGCSGLPSPPFEHYHVVGNSPTINGDVTFDFSKLADGPLTIEIEPDLTPLTCEEIPTHIDPCMQTPLREATLTISLAD